MMPKWMSELYIAVLKFGVPTNKLMFYRRTRGVIGSHVIDRPWTVGTVKESNSNVDQFLELLQERDEKDIDF